MQARHPAALAVGSHQLTASYLADQVFKTSSGSGRITVTRAGSVLDASVSPNPVKPAVAAKASVKATTSTGLAGAGEVTVHVQRNVSTVATLVGTLDESGALVVTLPKLAAGSYKVTVSDAASPITTAGSVRLSLSVQN